MAALALVFGTACGPLPGAGPVTDGGPTADAPDSDSVQPRDVPPGTCIPNPTLIASRMACRTDARCPCGTHCDLGVCVASCSAATPCAAPQRCDSFGRCREPGDDDLFPAAPATAQGQIALFQSDMVFASAETVVELRYTAQRAAVDRLRWVAPAGMEVRCTPTAAFAAECVATDVTVGAVRVVSVRSRPGSVPLLRPQTLFGYYASTVVSASAVPPAPRPTGGSSWAGTYTGTLTLTAVDVRATGASTGVLALENMPPIRVRANIFAPRSGNNRRIQLFDDHRVLHPSGSLIGTFSGTDASTEPQLSFPNWRVFTDDDAAPFLGIGAVDVSAQVATSCSGVVTGTRAITCRLDVFYNGVFNDTRVPWARYMLTLTDAGSLPSGATAPDLPQPYSSTVETALLREPARTPWEAAVYATFEPASSFGGEATQALAGLQLSPPASAMGLGRLDACRDDLLTTTSAMQAALVTPLRTSTILSASMYDTGELEIPIESRNGLAHALYRWLGTRYSRTGGGVQQLTVTPPAPISSSSSEVELPCGFRVTSSTSVYETPFSTTCGMPVVVSRPAANLEFADESCARLRAATGCTIEVLSTPLPVPLTLTYAMAQNTGLCMGAALRTVTLQTTASHVCRLQTARPLACAELALCAEPTNFTTRASMTAPRFGSALHGLSDDLACASGDRGAGIDLELTSRPNALETCHSDRSRADSGPPTTSGVNGAGLRRVFSSEGCIDTARVLYALGEAGNLRRGSVTIPAEDPAARRTDRLLLRLTQEWVAAHSFMANEAASAWHAAAGLRGEPGVSTTHLQDSFRHSIGAWRVLMHPRFSTPLLRLPANRYVSPDYRSSYDVTATGQTDINVGLTVTMLQLLTGQVKLADEMNLDEEMRAPTATTASVDFGRVARSASLMLPLAMYLANQAGALGTAGRPSWARDWDAALNTYRASLSLALDHLDRRVNARNPLGIEDLDAPLYYQGDNVGATSRFNAISDYLLGASPMSTAIAPVAIAHAESLLAEARSEYGARFGRSVGAGNGGRGEVADDYGTRLAALCGLPPGLTSATALSGWTNFNAANCYIRSTDPICRPPAVPTTAMTVTNDDVGINNCYRTQIAARLTLSGSGLTQGQRTNNNDLLFYAQSCNPPSTLSPDCMGRFPVGTLCATCGPRREGGGASGYSGVIPLGSAYLRPAVWTLASGSTLYHERVIPGAVVSESVDREVRAQCQALYPSGRLALAGSNPSSQPTPAACYRGSIGELALALHAAALDVQIANSEMGDLMSAYDISMSSCDILQTSATRIASSQAAHDATMQSLRVGKAVADSIAAAAASTKDCADALKEKQGVGEGIQCGAAIVEGAANIASIAIQAEMDRAQAAHESHVMMLETSRDIAICTNDATQNLVGMRTASLRVTRAEQEVQSALFRFTQAVEEAQGTYDEGIGLSRAHENPSTAAEVWVDDRIDSYLTALRGARRASYLAVRAVEYEMQASLMLRARVLAAPRPVDLTSVMADLRATAATRSINGRRPSALTAVISLRDNVLQLGDTSMRSTDWNTLSAAQRLRALLNDRRYVVPGGRRIPFNLTPVPGTSGAISFLTGGTDCAERVWSINASILGSNVWRTTTLDDAGTSSSAPSFVRIDLLKSNTFSSQWCTPPAGASAGGQQLTSVRPSRNLFADPLTPTMVSITAPEETLESRGRMQAFLGVDRAALERETYANTGSSELAARGLYGQYAIFIPNDTIAETRNNGTVTREGLDLNRIDDILLRVDYISVSR